MNTLLFMLVCVGLLLYPPLNKRKAKYYWESKWDKQVPFLPVFIIPYVGFIPFVFGGMLVLMNTSVFTEFLFSFSVLIFVSSLFWYLFPNGVKRPVIDVSKTHFEKVAKFIFENDGDSNGLPSGHVGYSFLIAWYLTLAYGNYWLIWTIALFIALSTLFTKQHYIIDFVLTPVFVVGAIYATYFLMG